MRGGRLPKGWREGKNRDFWTRETRSLQTRASRRYTGLRSSGGPERRSTMTTATGRRVLIVSASAGGGHVRAGEALAEAFREDGAARVLHVDVLALAPRWVRLAYGGGFELVAA